MTIRKMKMNRLAPSVEYVECVWRSGNPNPRSSFFIRPDLELVFSSQVPVPAATITIPSLRGAKVPSSRTKVRATTSLVQIAWPNQRKLSALEASHQENLCSTENQHETLMTQLYKAEDDQTTDPRMYGYHSIPCSCFLLTMTDITINGMNVS